MARVFTGWLERPSARLSLKRKTRDTDFQCPAGAWLQCSVYDRYHALNDRLRAVAVRFWKDYKEFVICQTADISYPRSEISHA